MITDFRKAVLLVLGCCLFLGVSAQAQNRGDRESERIRILESKVQQLESLIYNLNQRVSNLEYRGTPTLPPPPVPASEVACMITDSGYGKVFLGKGRTKLEAEAKAKEVCGANVHATYCNNTLKCSDPVQDRVIQGAICVITDSGYGKTFKGEAKSVLEAEYNARKACNNAVHATYCNTNARCDTF
ncbi:hypothetical protein AZI85_13200 [Bdellovibrio bacteriovorus]|uniref:DUF4189 domain-containing protein n=1 Tax=Bdellovibrio bacteriovorus TaxID=959 RepID=A0A150WBT0_BDEBC|nr:hypothetical protein [Bdellovibrio bacteriovorus]KYG60419.1 hypothetical protein AZI85_13200 [Bdellovibrio bacteriovorus]